MILTITRLSFLNMMQREMSSLINFGMELAEIVLGQLMDMKLLNLNTVIVVVIMDFGYHLSESIYLQEISIKLMVHYLILTLCTILKKFHFEISFFSYKFFI